ncbi:integrase [Dysgonomonas sp. PH5-45]|uniref:site-specific integrase n=1 Tax=unclassified Dysgonomonas TaxID=2630389 RepID=UPI0024746F03|nr:MULTISPECIES: site-specific integrase [unclassified Dysgonomonas]MDH6355993.1 integrase [Dysgonomonas sp. PH5-45]MDH6388888.1 integrase [Dysgonomonas sp. PH5-37]
MNATVNVVLFKSKTLADGSHPLMIRICKNNKKKYKSLGISIQPQFWDFEKNKPKRNCPNKDSIQTIIIEKTKEFSGQIIEFKTINKDFTVSSLIEKVEAPTVNNTVQQLFNSEIDRLRQENRLKTASIYKELLVSMLDFNTHLDIYFSEIDIIWLREYEAFLRKKGLSDNSLGVRFRTLRSIFNKAIELNIVKQEYYPFKVYKVSKLHTETVKRAIQKSDIEAIINYNADSEYTRLAIDLFYFSYLSGGINFVDIAHLTKSNIIEDRLIYTRKKTKKLIKIPLQLKASELIGKYSNPDNPYLFPIFTSFHKTEQQRANRVHKVLAIINKRLKQIGQELNISIDLTTYVARHSFATVLKRSGVNTSIISESLGHSSEKVTQIYLDSFENSQIDEAMKNLL